MRSICARLSASNSAWPSVAEPTRTPSISTTVLFVLAPRMKKPELWPGPPLRDELQAGLAAQQVLDRVGARVADRVGVDDDDVGRAAADRLAARAWR